MNIKSLRILSSTIFFLGVILGFVLAIVSLWGNVEALNYFFRGASYTPFQGLKCPILMTRSESGAVTAVFDNPTSTEDTFYYKVQISNIVSPRIIEDQIAVPTHQTKDITFTVNNDDIDLEFFVFVKITISPNSSRPTQAASCGIMVLNNQILNGGQIFELVFALSLLGIVIGFSLWQRTSREVDSNIKRLMLTLAIVVLLAMFAGLVGWWLAGTVLAVLTILLLLIGVRFAFA